MRALIDAGDRGNVFGRFHGRSSFKWNGEDQRRGRQVWHNCFDREIKSHRHFWATVNYIHNNPAHHGYADKWQDWPWSSATEFLERVGRETAEKIWREYPILDYGKKWDVDPQSEPEESVSEDSKAEERKTGLSRRCDNAVIQRGLLFLNKRGNRHPFKQAT
jgi:hypothetical protein